MLHYPARYCSSRSSVFTTISERQIAQLDFLGNKKQKAGQSVVKACAVSELPLFTQGKETEDWSFLEWILRYCVGWWMCRLCMLWNNCDKRRLIVEMASNCFKCSTPARVRPAVLRNCVLLFPVSRALSNRMLKNSFAWKRMKWSSLDNENWKWPWKLK